MGKTQTPAALDTVQQGITDANSGLAQRAQQYTQTQEANQNYGLDTSVLDQAIAGNSNAGTSTTGLLNRQNINAVDSFDPGNTTVQNADLLSTPAGLRQLNAIGQGPQYTPGMSAFDTMLLQKDPNYNASVQNLQKQNADLQTNAAAQPAALQQTVTDYGNQNLAAAQAAAKGYLTTQQQAVLAAEQASADAANKGLTGLDHTAIQNAALAGVMPQATSALDTQFGTGRAAAQLAALNIDPSKYITYASQYDPSQFTSADQAQKYNQINTLLGNGGLAQVASAGSAPSPYTVDTQGLLNALKDPAAAARMQQDTTDQGSISKILQDATTQAAATNKTNSAAAANYLPTLQTLGQSIIPGLNSSLAPYETADNLSSFNKQYAASNPINPYYTTPLQAQDVLGQPQVDQLTALQKDLYGTGPGATNYSVGQYATPQAPGAVDNTAYTKALTDYLQGLVPAGTPPPATGGLPPGSDPRTQTIGVNQPDETDPNKATIDANGNLDSAPPPGQTADNSVGNKLAAGYRNVGNFFATDPMKKLFG